MTSEQRQPRRSARAGEPASPGGFDDVYRAHFAYVWRALRRLGVPAPDIEDLVHDVFVVVHRRFADFERGRAIRPWLFGIAFRLASESRRRARNRREIPTSSVDPPGRLPAADALIETDERRQMVLDCLQSLSLEQRAVLILIDIDGEPPAEVAHSLRTPLPTVYSRLRAARVRFAAVVRRAKLRQGDT